MIPRLFEKTATTFTNYGICPLIDAISCTVTEERNGEYTLELTYPREGRWADELIVDRIILADPADNADAEPADNADAEPFRIVEVEYDMNGDMTISAEHVSYQLNHVIVGKMSESTQYPATLWTAIQSHLLTSNPFSFSTDISDENAVVRNNHYDQATPLRKILGGMSGSFLDNYGGEFEWNRYTVKLWASRGTNNGVKIAYTKNLTGLTYDIDMSNVYSGVIAYWEDENNYVESALQTVTNTYSYNRVKVIDVSDQFDTQPTVAQLNTWASNYVTANAPSPNVSVEVEFVPLWQTEEYKDFYGLEHVSLCDTVRVIYPPLNLDVSAKVVKTVYNVLADRYDEITISTVRADITDTILNLMKESEK